MCNYHCTNNNLYDVYEMTFQLYTPTKNELDTDYYLEEDTQKENINASFYKLKKESISI